MAYHLMELIEEHAFETYDAFLQSHGEELRAQPVPAVAKQYYTDDQARWCRLYRVVHVR